MKTLAKLATATALVAISGAASAAVTIDITETGADVTATLSGSLDLGEVTFESELYFIETGVRAEPGYIGFGTDFNDVTGYLGFTGPVGWGPGTTYFAADSSSGDDFGFNTASFGGALVFVSPTYDSGSSLSGTSLFLGQTLASLGLTVGTYVYTSGDETLTVNIGGGAEPIVPEPASWAMMIAGFGLVGGALRRRGAAVRFA